MYSTQIYYSTLLRVLVSWPSSAIYSFVTNTNNRDVVTPSPQRGRWIHVGHIIFAIFAQYLAIMLETIEDRAIVTMER